MAVEIGLLQRRKDLDRIHRLHSLPDLEMQLALRNIPGNAAGPSDVRNHLSTLDFVARLD